MSNATILLAEDHVLVRQGIRHMLELHPEFEVVAEVSNGQDAIESIEKLKPDIAIIDIKMPRLNGIEVVRQMKKRALKTRALVLTAYANDEYVNAMLRAGAAGYILKTITADALIASIRAICQGELVLDSSIRNKIIKPRSQKYQNDGIMHALSSRELEILDLASNGLHNKDIASKLNLSVRTVEATFAHIYNKLNVSSRTEAVILFLSSQSDI